MSVPLDLTALLRQPFCMIRREGADDVLLLEGAVVRHEWLDQILTAPKTVTAGQENFASINFLPFSTVRERGFVAHGTDEKIASLEIAQTRHIPVAELLAQLAGEHAALTDAGNFGESDAAYADLVRDVIKEDIGNGEGANFVIPRWYRAQIADYAPRKALAAFAHLLREEQGTYWTFLFFDGAEFLVGATPERHISLQNGLVKMNPISGTLRKAEIDPAQAKEQLLAFINDKKETFELLMVVDEELKMIADFCPTGGQVIGPLLKEMAHLVHSEYLLAGPTDKGVIDLLRGSMFAATVTGSPIESAMRVIKKREPGSRHYYGSVLALIGTDAANKPTLDAPILIRTAHIDATGKIAIGVGTTIVFHSNPDDEVKETHAKAAGIMRAFGLKAAGHNRPSPSLKELIASEEIQFALNLRNKDLSRFWIDYQDDDFTVDTSLAGKRVLIVDNEDSFTHMLAHMLRRLGMHVHVVGFEDMDAATMRIKFDPTRNPIIALAPNAAEALRDKTIELLSNLTPREEAAIKKRLGVDSMDLVEEQVKIEFSVTRESIRNIKAKAMSGLYKNPDLIILGPGPGDPNNMREEKMRQLRTMVDTLLASDHKFLCVCLAHQSLCGALGFTVAKKHPAAFQGRQEIIDYYGRKQRVGFYNTFVGHYEKPVSGLDICHAPVSGDIHALRHARFGSVQFHAESILTTNGLQMIQDEMVRLLKQKNAE
jgi:phenazine biosynthesis protein phzE